MSARHIVRLGKTQVVMSALLACVPVAAHAQTAPQVFLTAYGGVAVPRGDAFETAKVIQDPDGSTEYKARYGLAPAGAFDLGGGVLLANRYTAGVSFSRAASSEKADVGLSFTHPAYHPTISGSLETEALERTESAVHLSLGYRVPAASRLDVHLFAGPSRVSVEQQLVADLDGGERFSTATRAWSVVLEDYELARQSGSAWGYHAGLDAGVRLTPRISVGGMLRYTAASVDVEEPVLTLIEDRTTNTRLKAGGLQAFAGIRIGL